METIFSKIIRKEIPAKIVYETDQVLAFEDIAPQAPHHIVIIPKKPIPTINDIHEDDAQLIGQLFLVAKEIAGKLGVASDGYRVVMNCNEAGGQTVFHIHLHLLAGRQLKWPPG